MERNRISSLMFFKWCALLALIWVTTFMSGCVVIGDVIPGCQDSDNDGSCDVDAGLCSDATTNGCFDCSPTDPDTDGDGSCESADPCPADAMNQCDCTVENPDSDGDLLCNDVDECPYDETNGCLCSAADPDADGDGRCDSEDSCPLDATDICGCPLGDPDSDGDGVCNSADGCPMNADVNCLPCPDEDPDDDEDGICLSDDSCPLDQQNLCDCTIGDPDRDGDGECDSQDMCPEDPNDECLLCGEIDTDADGVFDDCDLDDDNDGILDDREISEWQQHVLSAPKRLRFHDRLTGEYLGIAENSVFGGEGSDSGSLVDIAAEGRLLGAWSNAVLILDKGDWTVDRYRLDGILVSNSVLTELLDSNGAVVDDIQTVYEEKRFLGADSAVLSVVGNDGHLIRYARSTGEPATVSSWTVFDEGACDGQPLKEATQNGNIVGVWGSQLFCKADDGSIVTYRYTNGKVWDAQQIHQSFVDGPYTDESVGDVHTAGNMMFVSSVRIYTFGADAEIDSDNQPAHLDTDSDGNGVFDAIEAEYRFGLADVDADGRLLGDVDENGVPLVLNGVMTVPVASDTGIGTPVGSANNIPDYLDEDNDNDYYIDRKDNCRLTWNYAQDDEDEDGRGDSCDNCPVDVNTTQLNQDADDLGDACDPNPGSATDRLIHFDGFNSAVHTETNWSISYPTNSDSAALVEPSTTQGRLVFPQTNQRGTLEYIGDMLGYETSHRIEIHGEPKQTVDVGILAGGSSGGLCFLRSGQFSSGTVINLDHRAFWLQNMTSGFPFGTTKDSMIFGVQEMPINHGTISAEIANGTEIQCDLVRDGVQEAALASLEMTELDGPPSIYFLRVSANKLELDYAIIYGVGPAQ